MNKEKYKQLKSMGLCPGCKKPWIEKETYCQTCRKRAVTYQKTLIENGKCKSCCNPLGEIYKSSNCKGLCVLCAEKKRENQKRYANKLKMLVYRHYGNQCACCGLTDINFLTIDHKNNDGNLERNKLGKQNLRGVKWYRKIIKTNYPDYLQLLCWNCNLGKALNNGVCPHKLTS